MPHPGITLFELGQKGAPCSLQGRQSRAAGGDAPQGKGRFPAQRRFLPVEALHQRGDPFRFVTGAEYPCREQGRVGADVESLATGDGCALFGQVQVFPKPGQFVFRGIDPGRGNGRRSFGPFRHVGAEGNGLQGRGGPTRCRSGGAPLFGCRWRREGRGWHTGSTPLARDRRLFRLRATPECVDDHRQGPGGCGFFRRGQFHQGVQRLQADGLLRIVDVGNQCLDERIVGIGYRAQRQDGLLTQVNPLFVTRSNPEQIRFRLWKGVSSQESAGCGGHRGIGIVEP